MDRHQPRLQGNIIVVGDNRSDLGVLAEILTKNGYTARFHIDGPSALTEAAAKPPALMLLDVNLAQMDGYTVCRQLKADERTANIPVIFMSAWDGVFNGANCFAAGGVDYIIKPFQPEEILAKIETHLNLRAMRQRLEVQNSLLQLVENLPVMVDAVDQNNNIIVWNRECERVTGYSAAEIIGNPAAFELLYPDQAYREQMFERFARLGGEFRNQEWQLVSKDGVVKTIAWSNVAKRFPIPGWKSWAVGVDVTKRKQAEEALRESEGRLRRAELLARMGHYTFDADLSNFVISDGLKEIWGFERGAKPDVSQFLARLHPDDQWALAELEKAAAEMKGFDLEYRIVHPDGSEVMVHSAAEIFLNEPGRPPRFFGTMVDITERKQAEEALRESDERFRSVFEQAAVGICYSDLDGKFIRVNKRFCEITGYNAEELLQMTYREITHPDDLAISPDQGRKLLAGEIEAYSFHKRYIRKDGAIIWVNLTVSLMYEASGDPKYEIGVIEDITERKQAEEVQAKLEEQLRQAQKLESIGLLAGGIAHDFNNLLVPIIGYAELGQVGLSPDSKLYTDLGKIKAAAERAASLTRQLLAFSRRQVLEIQVFDLNMIITEFQEMLRRLITEDIEVQVFLAATPCLIQADRTQIEQILLNLSINARDAMTNGGQLVIETDNVYLDEAYAQTHSETQPGHYVMLSLSDTGHGMDAETQKHIFEPFFTTKEQGKGTGLGLAMVFGIVKQHQGNIWVYSEPGKGTIFKIYLPQPDETVQPDATGIIESTAIYGTETVLVVEDEPMVRKLARETLEAYRYTVIEAESPNKGLQIASTYEGHIHLLLTDVIMPGMNGRELYEKSAVVRPDLKVLYMSGYTDNVIVHHGVLDEGVNFLQKPFTVLSLTQKVRRVLD